MLVRDVMTRHVPTIRADETIERARIAMSQAGVHQLVVRAKHGAVVGVIGHEDLFGVPHGARVEDFIRHRLVSVRSNAPVGDAAALMHTHAVGSLPVMSGGRLVGLVTVAHMLDLVERQNAATGRIASARRTPVS